MDSVKRVKKVFSFFLILFFVGFCLSSSFVQAEETDKGVETTGIESEEESKSEEETSDFSGEEEILKTELMLNETETTEDGLPIIYDNGIHYIVDPNYPDRYLILYCMNNKSHWPHEQPSLGESVPNYKYGYLTPEQFESEEKYRECMQRLDEILFTGYPYNGNLLYKLVEDGDQHVISEEDFNQMLVPSRALVECFPILQGQTFTVANRKEKIDLLNGFIQQVSELYPDGTIDGKLSYSAIVSMPFYKAVMSITWTDGEGDPIEAYMALYPDSYYVTEKQAYDATQNAVWKLLYDYGVEDNDLSDISSSNLAQIIYDNSRYSSILRAEPDLHAISIEGDSTFRYDPKDGKWHTGTLRITEPADYYGVYYTLDLPTGITVSGNNEFKGNEPFELVSDQMPAKNTEITIASEISWLKETRQYTPNPDKVVNGKRFQHMAGAVVMSKEAKISFNCDVKQTADLTISKLVEGRMGDRTKKFPFTIYLHHENGTPFTGSVQTEGSVIDGYEGVCEAPNVGGLVFDEQGKAIVELTHGQKLTIKDLPIGCQYLVSEPEEIHTEYKVTYNNNEEKPQGMLSQNVDIQVINRKDEVPETGIMDGKTGIVASIWMGVCSIAILIAMSLRKRWGKRQK
ncbi:MAG: hypothetical protein ACI4DZ_15985 [Oliverpabstia sp.]